MLYRNLGTSGLKVSVIGLGTNQFGGKVSQKIAIEIIDSALDVGINFVDTADVYQEGRSEEYIGNALEGKRDKVLIATKVYHPTNDDPNARGASRKHILQGIEASLKRLKTDYIDLYQIHRWDPETQIEETLRTLEDLIRSGKIRYIGASNFNTWQLTWSIASSKLSNISSFVSIQPHFHMFERDIEKELIPACEYLGIGIIPYFPLAGGFLTGKYKQDQPTPPGSRGESSQYVQRYMTDLNYSKLAKLETFAHQKKHNLTELAHAWLLAQPMVSSVISGATKVAHVLSNAESFEWELNAADIKQINEILERG
jgi:aryl-alcohol dehydrogenase-like predicted oxidoreductase